jgi:hypothetical protein
VLNEEEKARLENLETLVKARTEQLRQALLENEKLRQALKEKDPNP